MLWLACSPRSVVDRGFPVPIGSIQRL